MGRVAVVLMNLGGPDRLEAVQPFLFNLFSDPAILRLPAPFRLPLAHIISRRRAPIAREIYRRLGGGSPLVANTEAQARALEAVLGPQYRCFVAMRYWHPTSEATAAEVADWGADQIVCLPLYPQFSTTTTASSLAAWRAATAKQGLDRPLRSVCCFHSDNGFVEALAGLIRPVLDLAVDHRRPPRLLLTAHGLPKRIVMSGDPYQNQVETTAASVIAALNRPGLDWTTCYQSRVGPLEWISPSTDSEIRRAGKDETPVVIAPISFVSEHSETLVELDIDYRDLAAVSGVPAYHRVPTVGTEPGFIRSLAALVLRAHAEDRVGSCASGFAPCALSEAAI
ncbi:MAG: ferrochelatase [Alphaproteobacteria bacterium]|nr:ferrochelatase [Alphaproteobacteria bacterium]